MLLFLSSRQNFLLRCWIQLPTFSQHSHVFSCLVFQILLYLKLKIKYSYPGTCCLSSLTPYPEYDKLQDFFAHVGLVSLFFLPLFSQPAIQECTGGRSLTFQTRVFKSIPSALSSLPTTATSSSVASGIKVSESILQTQVTYFLHP